MEPSGCHPLTCSASPRSLPTLSIATQQLGRLQSVRLAANNVTGAIGCDNAGPALQELDLSNNG